jgi:outer membrane protein W
MRKLLIVLLMASASTVFAQQKNSFSVFVTDFGLTYSSASGTNYSSGIGFAFDRMFTPRLSGEFAISTEQHRTYPYIVAPDGSIRQVTPVGFRTYPIDLALRYHFLNDSRWKPYLGVGAHYIGAPHVGSGFRYQNHIGPEIVGGTVLQLGRSFGFVLDGKVYLGDRESYVPPFSPSFGLNWRF